MGIPDSGSGKRGKEAGMKDTPDFIFAAKIRPEHPVGPAFGKDLIDKHVFLEKNVGTHDVQPVSFLFQAEKMKVTDEDMRGPCGFL